MTNKLKPSLVIRFSVYKTQWRYPEMLSGHFLGSAGIKPKKGKCPLMKGTIQCCATGDCYWTPIHGLFDRLGRKHEALFQMVLSWKDQQIQFNDHWAAEAVCDPSSTGCGFEIGPQGIRFGVRHPRTCSTMWSIRLCQAHFSQVTRPPSSLCACCGGDGPGTHPSCSGPGQVRGWRNYLRLKQPDNTSTCRMLTRHALAPVPKARKGGRDGHCELDAVVSWDLEAHAAWCLSWNPTFQSRPMGKHVQTLPALPL